VGDLSPEGQHGKLPMDTVSVGVDNHNKNGGGDNGGGNKSQAGSSRGIRHRSNLVENMTERIEKRGDAFNKGKE
jgi:hypothetical protein